MAALREHWDTSPSCGFLTAVPQDHMGKLWTIREQAMVYFRYDFLLNKNTAKHLFRKCNNVVNAISHVTALSDAPERFSELYN